MAPPLPLKLMSTRMSGFPWGKYRGSEKADSERSSESAGDMPQTPSRIFRGNPDDESDWFGVTTLVVHNIPSRYTQERLLNDWREPSIDFLYLPYRVKQRRAARYAFVNFTTSEEALRFRDQVDGSFLQATDHQLSVGKAKSQGLAANVLLHRATFEQNQRCRPVVFKRGQRVDFEELLSEIIGDISSGSDTPEDSPRNIFMGMSLSHGQKFSL